MWIYSGTAALRLWFRSVTMENKNDDFRVLLRVDGMAI